MPSPIAHAAVGALISKAWPPGKRPPRRIGGVLPVTLVACVGLSLLPDLDAAVGIALGNLGRYHNNLAGSPAFGLGVALVAGSGARLVSAPAAPRAFLLTLVCYELHVLLDYLTVGRGVMLLWPLSAERFAPPIYLFYGLHWSDGLVSARHLVTVVTELAFVAVIFAGVRWHTSRGSPAG